MKVFSLDLNTDEPQEAYFFATKGEVLKRAKLMRASKTPYTIRQHSILGGMNAKVLAKILNDASNQPWSEVEVLQVYDGKRKARSDSGSAKTSGVILTPGEQEEFEQALTEAAAKRRKEETLATSESE